MRFRYTSNISAIPFEPDDHVVEGIVDVMIGDDVVERLAIDYIDAARVAEYGERLWEVCDSDSQGWCDVFTALFDPKTEDVVEEIGCADAFDNVMLLYKMRLHPVIRKYEAFIIYQAAHIRGYSTLFTMLEMIPQTPQRELAQCGFMKLASSRLLFLPCMNQTECPKIDEDAVLDLYSEEDLGYTQELELLWDKSDEDYLGDA